MADSYTELERAVVVLVENFYKYVSKHSLVKNKISKSSFRKMLQKELNHMLTVRSTHPRTLSSPQPPKPLSSHGTSLTVVLSFQRDPPNQGLSAPPFPAPVLSGYPDLTREGLVCIFPGEPTVLPGARWGHRLPHC